MLEVCILSLFIDLSKKAKVASCFLVR